MGAVRFTGIDINSAMIRHCAATLPDQHWVVASPPYAFADGQFDYCVIVNVLHHLHDRAEMRNMLSEAARISKRVLLFEPLQSESALLHALKRLYWSITDGGSDYLRLAEFHALFAEARLRLTWERSSEPFRHFYGARLVRDL